MATVQRQFLLFEELEGVFRRSQQLVLVLVPEERDLWGGVESRSQIERESPGQLGRLR